MLKHTLRWILALTLTITACSTPQHQFWSVLGEQMCDFKSSLTATIERGYCRLRMRVIRKLASQSKMWVVFADEAAEM